MSIPRLHLRSPALLLSIAIAFLGAQATLGAPLALDRVDVSWPLGNHADFWLDERGKAHSIDEVEAQATWQPVGEPRKSLRLRRGILWLRVPVQNALTDEQSRRPPDFRVEFSHPRPIELSAWVPRQGKRVRVEGGLVTPLPQREVESRSVVVPFDLPPGQADILYFRLDTAPLGFSAEVVSAPHSAKVEARASWFLGLYYGIALGLFVYNGALWLRLRAAAYGWYLLFLFTTVVFFAARNGYVWASGWTPDTGLGGGLLVSVQLLAVLNFARGLLGTSESSPRLDRVMQWGCWASAFAGVITAMWPSQTTETAVAPLSVLLLVVTIAAAAQSALAGDPLARLFLLAWGIYLFGAFLYVFKSTGLIPHNLWTEHGMQVGSAVEMSLLSLALAERVRSLQRLANQREQEVIRLRLEHASSLSAMREESARRIIDAGEEHSRRLAEDLHDSVGHRFLLILRMVQEWTAGHGDDTRSAIEATAREGVEETREIAHGLYPQRLLTLGLEASLQAAADAVGRAGIPVHTALDAKLSEGLDHATRLAVLRIAEEALQNAVRHAEARLIRLTWQRSSMQTAVELSVIDDGIGHFAKAESEGLGLRTMRDRALQIHAELQIEGKPGAGTCVRLCVPLTGTKMQLHPADAQSGRTPMPRNPTLADGGDL